MDLTDLASGFPGRYWPTDGELTRLWDEGVLVLDASVLLGFYRYSEETREAMFRVLARFSDRIFVPHQAAEEFQRNRLSVISHQVAVYAEIEDELHRSVEVLRNRARELRRHPVLEAEEVLRRLDAFEEDLTAYIKRRREDHPNLELTPTSLMRDPVRERIQAAVGQKVGPSYEASRCEELESKAQARFDREQPPGFRDRNKGGPRQFGDVYFWMQTLDFARESGLPTIVVTDDEKDDWWWQFKGKTLGPRPELVAEMRTVTEEPMFMYTSSDLLKEARRFLSETVSDETIDEVQEIARELRTRATSEAVDCPHCGWSPVTIKIGLAAGSSAIGRCPSCQYRFHAHRARSGETRTSRGSLGRRIQARCPECADEIRVDFADGDGGRKERVCVSCFAMFDVESSGEVELKGFATVVDSDRTDERRVSCPRCGTDHATFARRGREAYAVCYAEEPHLLLRGDEVSGGPLDPD